MPLAGGPRAFFPPEVAIHVVRLACERPDLLGRSLSQWDCQKRARQLIAEGIVADISAATVRRILRSHKLKPWRCHFWLHPKKPRDAAFYATVSELIDLYTRPLPGSEIVLAMDEKTSLQPRPRQHPTLPAQPQHLPTRCEHEYKRAGALNLFAAFDTRAGKVYGQWYDRKRQQEVHQRHTRNLPAIGRRAQDHRLCSRTDQQVCTSPTPATTARRSREPLGREFHSGAGWSGKEPPGLAAARPLLPKLESRRQCLPLHLRRGRICADQVPPGPRRDQGST